MSFCLMWRKFRRAVRCVVLVGGVLMTLFAVPALSARVAYAQDTGDEAEKQFQNGVERYKQGDYRAALEFFLASNRLAPNKNVLLNIARCYEQLNQFPEAYRYYSIVLEQETEPAARERVRDFLARVTPKVAVLQVTSDPPGALIFINRKDLGTRGPAPRSIGLGAGKYKVIVELPGYEAAESPTLDLLVGTTTPVTLKLIKLFGTVRIEGVNGATVRTESETGPTLCVAPCEAKLAPGKQTLYLTKDGFHTTDVLVDVVANQTTVSRPRLMVQTGTLVISSDVKDALVTVDGKAVGIAPATVNVPVGRHRVSVSQTGYTPVEKEIFVKEDSEQKVSLSLSEQASDLLNATTTTATRTAEKVEEAPGSITVITRQQILDMNARTMREVLNVFVPGMDVVPTYFRFGDRVNEGIYSRGLLSDFSQQVLILHNGSAKYNETTFSSAFTSIDFTLDNVERIEVSRTPIPIYGGSAITIINIVTREQFVNGAEGNISMVTGDRDGPLQGGIRGKNFSTVAGRDFGSWHFGASAQFYDDNGQFHDKQAIRGGFGDGRQTRTTVDPNGGPSSVADLEVNRRTIRDGTKSGAVASANIRTKDQRFSIEAQYKNVNKDAFLSGLVPSQSNDFYTYRAHHFLGAVKFRPIDELEFTVGGMQTKWTNTINFGGPFGGDESNYHIFADAIFRKGFNLAGKHTALIGTRIESEGQYDATLYTWTDQSNMSPDRNDKLTFSPNDDRQVLGLFAEDTWRLTDGLSILGGGRFDFYNGFGNKVNGDRLTSAVFNPRIAATWSPFKEMLFKLLYASAVRPPSIYERAGINLPPLAGSSGTTNERIDTIELSSALRLDQFKVQVTPFVQFFSDRIEYVQTDPTSPTLTAGNSGNTLVRGIDGDVRFFFNPRNYVFANASFIASEDTSTKSRTLFLPNTYVNGGVNFNIYNFNVNLTEYFRGPRRVPFDATTGQPYVPEEFSRSTFWMNLSLAYNITPSIRPYFTIENLTNTRNYVPLATPNLAVPMRSQSYWLGLTYAWR